MSSAPPANAAPCDPPIVNPVACENTKPGNPPSEWDISGAGSSTIQGFATDISVDQGQTVQFKVDTPASSYRLDIYRMGYYGGQGARKIATVNPSASLPQNQPNCLGQSTTGLIDCGNWAVSASWSVPSDAVSGIYFAKLVRTDNTAGSSQVFFVVRDDDGGSDILFQTSDTTWQAYNEYGGNSLYTGQPDGRAYKVSYNRPFTTRSDNTEDWLFNAEYPAVRFLEANGYNVSYFTDVDTDRRGSELVEHDVFLSVGHDEYWSGQQRANVEAARDAGVHLAFFSGNEIFWKTRWENSIDGSGTPYRTLVTYKETHANDTIDPLDPPIWTGTWMDPRFSPPADGGRPQNQLTGQLFGVNCCTYDMQVNAADGDLRLWRNTRAATLTGNQTTTLGDSLLGYEWDISPDNGFRPPGLIHLSSTTISGAEILLDYGSSYGSGTATHNLSLYRASSGALVFGAGTVQWSWGLDDQHDRGASATSDVAVRQATVNLFADMGVQPATLQSGLVAASQTTDTTAPTSTITSPANGATVPVSQALTISGTASDTGGLVGGVEVSVDGGATWHPASGRATWTYTFTPTANGQITIKSRATDDSGRTETPGAGITVTVGSGSPPPTTCPCTIWTSGDAPINPAEDDSAAVEVGVKFRADQTGVVTGVRFYKGNGNTGTHVGKLWTSSGTLLASATFIGETATGWQQVDFATPVSITANTTYVASYYAPVGRYAADSGGLSSAVTRGPLTALADGVSGGNGVYQYGTGGGFPSNTYQSTNYWVDVVFDTAAEDMTPPTVTARTPASGATGVPVGTAVTATFSEPVQESTITIELRGPGGTLVTGTKTYDSGTRTVTFTPGAALAASTSYTATVSGAKDAAGNTMTAVDWSFTTGTADTTPPTVVGRTPAPSATNVPLTTTVTATFSEAVQSGTIAMELRGPGTTLVPSTVSYNAGSLTATLTPGSPLAQSTLYTATVSGARDAAGNTMAPVSWTFTTSALGCPCTIWPSTATPQTSAANDSAAVELGVKFRANQSGVITSIRFYKGTANTGTHVGHLWTSSGTLLGTVTFSGETATGWQQATFATPIAITANTTYVASYYAPVGRYALTRNYFTSATTNGPLTALANGTDGGNGVYRYGTGGGFPTSSWQASNYWVDVVFNASSGGADTTPPTVTSRAPVPGATGVATTTAVTATFSEDVQPATIVMELRDPGNTLIPATVGYDTATRTVTLSPTSPLAAGTTYTVNLSGAKDVAGNTMTAVSWSFTTASGASGCPCTIWPDTATPGTPAESDSSAVELGVRFRADRDGVITGIRFYKGTGNTGTHIGNLWTNTGTQLATVTFVGESASGWQQAFFASPVPISANTTYVASYHAPVGRYAVDDGYFASAGTVSGPLTALQNGIDGANGVYGYGASGFPTDSFQGSNYWVDVVFQTDAADTTPPTVTARTPAPGASGVPATTTVTATFSEAVQESTIVVELRDPSNNLVAGAKSYNASSRTVTFTPNDPLSASTSYTASVSGAKDIAGNTMTALSWSFTTAAPPPPPPTEGPGGPIAVITSTANPYSRYFAEILRAEGLNEFATVDVGSLSALTLAPYDVVIVGEVALTAAQASTLSTWVDGGGNLIAMRPDSDLNSLLGISSAGTTLADAYLRVDTTTAPGAGITAETVQFHGIANRYTLSGAQTVATLYSSATTATTNPAVTLRNVGANGGQAATFAYDLARSVVYTRQGNPAWAGQERDGISPIRSDDLYFGGAATDWVNLNKVAIPQADEQQRLLANLIEVMNRDRKPLPRFWYFPNSHKAVVVGTGDDHGNDGTSGRFNDLLAASPSGCSVANWTCPRFTSYIYPNTPITQSQASAYVAQGFEIALHPENGCQNFASPADLSSTYDDAVAAFQQQFPNLPALRTNRFHCLVWSDWASQPITELARGMRLDVNYYYWPGGWINDRPGFMTGSGIPMRFTDSTGSMIDIYQSNTVMTDESEQSYPFTPNTLLDNALGPLGYYGAFTANMHTDQASTFESDALLASASARNVPVISALQLLTWLDGRNGSSFGSITYNGNTLTFSVSVGAGADGLTGMLPVAGPGGATLASLSRNGSPVSFTSTTIKGQSYAMFAAAAGSYTATYSSGGGTATLSAATVDPSSDGESATISWNSETPSSTVIAYDEVGPSAGGLEAEATASLTHSLTLDSLEPDTTYTYRVISTDTAGETAAWPESGEPAATFKTPAADTAAPKIDRVAVRPLPDGTAIVTWRTNEPATSEVTFGTAKAALDQDGMDDELVKQHAVVVTDLEPDTTYWFAVASTDEAGNATKPTKARRFAATAAGVADHTAVQFEAGSASGVTVADTEFGALTPSSKAAGVFVSRVLDAKAMVTWDRAYWYGDVPAGAAVRISVRTGSTPEPDATWSEWTTLDASGDRVAGDSRYIQYYVELVSSRSGKAPTLTAIGFTHNGDLPGSIGELGDSSG